MKRCWFIVIAVGLSLPLSMAPTASAHAQFDIFGSILKAIIRAADLRIQKQQNHVIDLQIIQRQIENELSKLKLAEIGAWVERQRKLYADYFDELWRVKQILADWQRIKDIIHQQNTLASEYTQAVSRIRQDGHFSAAELDYMLQVYTGILHRSIESANQIVRLVTNYDLQMSDGDRWQVLHQCANDIDQQISDLKTFNRQNSTISLQRAHDQEDINTVRRLYGIP